MSGEHPTFVPSAVAGSGNGGGLDMDHETGVAG
jgi:hypothetical protein